MAGGGGGSTGKVSRCEESAHLDALGEAIASNPAECTTKNALFIELGPSRGSSRPGQLPLGAGAGAAAVISARIFSRSFLVSLIPSGSGILSPSNSMPMRPW